MEKVAFIVCYNNELYMRECMDYISWIKVPEGVETEVIGIAEAESMTSGYNAAMHASDAKYKVYLHQDLFILNENFIRDILKVFGRHPEYGMLGVIGSSSMVSDANYWDQWNCGVVEAEDVLCQGTVWWENPMDIEEVRAIDGMIMVTQYDIEWRQDIFDGFDFYDVSQSIEFQKAGWKVGVPHQEKPWCNHVCGVSKIEMYEIYRKKFCEEYKELGYHYNSCEQMEEIDIRNKEVEKILPQIEKTLEKGELDRAIAFLDPAMSFFSCNTQLLNLWVIAEVMQGQRAGGIKQGFWTEGCTLTALVEKLYVYKFLLKRLEYNKSIENLYFILEDIADKCEVEGLEAEKIIAMHAVKNAERVIWKLKWQLQTRFQKSVAVQFDDKACAAPEEKERGKSICADLLKIVFRLEENLSYDGCREALETVFDAMEAVARETHIGHIDETLYLAYFDMTEKHENKEAVLKLCREWLEDILEG